MKIYTKTGDEGKTALFGGTKVSKAHYRIEAYGTIDELNSYIGLLGDCPENYSRKKDLLEIQDRLFTMGSLLATDPEKKNMKVPDLYEADIRFLENRIDHWQDQLPPQRHFILPGGHPAISWGHIARCVCRRAERLVVLLKEKEPVDGLILQYLNRLSDFLFVLCRVLHMELDIKETPWKPRFENENI